MPSLGRVTSTSALATAAQATGIQTDTTQLRADTVNLLAKIPAVPQITSVQYGTIVLSSATSAAATISSVDLTKSCVVFLGSTNLVDSGSFRDEIPRVTLTNATTVTASKDVAGTGTVTVAYVVVQFLAVTSIQQGTVTISSALTGTATITSVNPARALVLMQGWQTTSTTWPLATGWLTLTSATVITATRGATTATANTFGFVVIEF